MGKWGCDPAEATKYMSPVAPVPNSHTDTLPDVPLQGV